MSEAALPILNRLPFAAGLPGAARAALADCCEVVEVAAGRTIFREGAEHATLYLIESGHVSLEMQVPGRGRVRMLSLGPGDMLGWSAVSGAGAATGTARMTASAVAIEPTRAVAARGADLRRLCETDAEFGRRFLAEMTAALSRRLLATRLQMLDLFAETQATG